MVHLSKFPLTPQLVAFAAVLGLLSSCATADRSETVSVYSPPPPRIGAAPISAYDAYAVATNLPVRGRSDLLAALVADVAAYPSPDPTGNPAGKTELPESP